MLVLAMLFIGYTFLSIEDIATQIEEPFAILPLKTHHQWLERDAASCRSLLWMDEEETKIADTQ